MTRPSGSVACASSKPLRGYSPNWGYEETSIRAVVAKARVLNCRSAIVVSGQRSSGPVWRPPIPAFAS